MSEHHWDDFRFVLALYRQGSIAAAARLLGVDNTTVTRRVSQVECALDTRLFDRARGRAIPTREGATVFRRLLAIDGEFTALHEEASGANRRIEGIVKVTAVPMIANRVLVPRLNGLLSLHPGLDVELLVDSALSSITRRRDADIAIRGARPNSDVDAITRKLGVMTYGLYCHRDLSSTNKPIDWIAYGQPRSTISRPQADWLADRITAEGKTARTRVNDGETLLQCVLSGNGKSLIADALARGYPELERLESDVPTPSRELWLLMHPSCREVVRIDVVAHWLAEQMRDWLGTRDSGDVPGECKGIRYTPMT